MKSKKINSKFAKLSGLAAIVFGSIAYASFRGNMRLHATDGAILKDTIKPINIRDKIASFGMELLGTPYVVAASGKDGFDCSGFVYYVFQHHKIMVPRSSPQFGHFGKEIPIENVKKGDILVFQSPTRNVIGHVGIVTNPKGKESDFIHASSGRDMKVIVTSLKKEGYARRFVKAVDVLSPF